jgi:hypothetical protein
VQALKAVEMKEPRTANYFRVVVERTAEQLARSKAQIAEIAREMQEIVFEFDGTHQPFTQIDIANIYTPNRDNCAEGKYGRECDYFKPHLYGQTTIDNVDYEETEDYINENSS